MRADARSPFQWLCYTFFVRAAGRIAARVAAAVWLLTVGASAVRAADTLPPRFEDRNTYDRFIEQGWDSPFGLDYVFVHSPGARDRALVDDFCKNVSVRWVNLTRLEWRIVERRAPKNGRHLYNWSDLDEAVRTWQRNGVHIMLSLRFASPWATAPRNDKEFVYLKSFAKRLALAGADYLPKPEHMQDLRDYVRNLVERYDGDGKDDMPGLLFPVLHYQVGNEYYNEVFWTGSVEQYGQLLREFSRTARSACPDVKTILSGIGFKEIYGYYALQMDPRTKAHVRQNLPKVPANMWRLLERTEAFSRKSVSFRDAYDILDARWPAAYTYDLVIQKLAGLKHIERLNQSKTSNVYVYRCTLNHGKLVWVAFCDDHIGQNHDQPTASVLATVPVGCQRLRVTHIITEIGQTKPKVVQAQANHGRLRLRLTEYPVLIEADEPSG